VIRPKVEAAIITGTMARPSRPSVRFTALEKPAIVMAAKIT
jgi:phosphoenolpyruvate synthase/pyruvate phosphate dikinase